jgi:hypothetical protein
MSSTVDESNDFVSKNMSNMDNFDLLRIKSMGPE